MHAIQEISETVIRDNISRAVIDVFKTMLGRDALLAAESRESTLRALPAGGEGSNPMVVGTVGFLGDANGLIYLYFDLGFARTCTCQLLSMTEPELEIAGDETINDAIGELTNMTVGSFKNGLCDAGYPCKLTIPSILRGSNFSIEPISTAQRYIFRFETAGSRLVADILMKMSD